MAVGRSDGAMARHDASEAGVASADEIPVAPFAALGIDLVVLRPPRPQQDLRLPDPRQRHDRLRVLHVDLAASLARCSAAVVWLQATATESP